jgi:hypothetical protein
LGHARPIEIGIWRRTQDNRVLSQTQDNQALCRDPITLSLPKPPPSPRGARVCTWGGRGLTHPSAIRRSGQIAREGSTSATWR